MKKIILLTILLAFGSGVFAKRVIMETAKKAAMNFYMQHAGETAGTPEISAVYPSSTRDIVTLYTFTFARGGFVIIAADDASRPVLAYSFDDVAEGPPECPATKDWLDKYSRRIAFLVDNDVDNTGTLPLWHSLLAGGSKSVKSDVGPLVQTKWAQGCYYNDQCPPDAAATGTCYHTVTGCVATAFGQILKYHNFPASGTGTHSYTHPLYGLQSADFGNTVYDWASMPNHVYGPNDAVATLMYHSGVSINMNYGVQGSNGMAYTLPGAYVNYFNYDPGIQSVARFEYPDVEDWKNILKTDLDQGLPIQYGSQPHSFVCDGYDTDDNFHFNWGWGGVYDGWFSIDDLTPSTYDLNNNETAIIHIKPYNPDLVIRFSNPADYRLIEAGQTLQVDAAVVKGTAGTVKILVDDVEKYVTGENSVSWTWETSGSDLGCHKIKAVALSGETSVYHEITVNVAKWSPQALGFSTIPRRISTVSSVDSNIVWANSIDDFDASGYVGEYSRTADGGLTWTTGIIDTPAGLSNEVICATDTLKAYVLNHYVAGGGLQGVYMTADGGTTWTRQNCFSTNSYPNCLFFFNKNDGWCMGDPVSGEFEIYTTSNGGSSWEKVNGSAIPDPVSGEYGWYHSFSAVNDTICFGTSKGRLFRSADKGHTWTVSSVPDFDGGSLKPVFQNGLHGLATTNVWDPMPGNLWETFDGGATWTKVAYTGKMYMSDVKYVPGTTNTWVSCGGMGYQELGRCVFGCSYSFDGGHTWTEFPGTAGTQFTWMNWISNKAAWAGGVNTCSGDGLFRYTGLLAPLQAPMDLQADVISQDVNLSWNEPSDAAPGALLLGYNMYRDCLKINKDMITGLTFTDTAVSPGIHLYMVKALYDAGESFGDSLEVEVFHVGVEDSQAGTHNLEPRVYPNPASVSATFAYQLKEESPVTLEISDNFGRSAMKPINRFQQAGSNMITLDVSSYAGGVYIYRLTAGDRIVTGKIIIIK